MKNFEQTDLFFDKNPELRKKNERANFRVSILGGNQSEEDAGKLGHKLAENWFSVSTGGYNMGTMKAALEGANKAVNKLKENSKNDDDFGQAKPTLRAVTADGYAPIEMATKGENITLDVAEGEHSLYVRLGKLIEESSAIVILPGDTGTEVEVLAGMHFDKKLKGRFKMKSSPVVLVGNYYIDLLKEKFGSLIENSSDIYVADSVEEAYGIIENLYEKNHGDEGEQKIQDFSEKLISNKIKNNQDGK